ncbi:MAG: CopG family transcriptional regulator [Bryobacterales bacterium]
MKRTQLYLEDDLWAALHVRSRQSGLSISELVRQAIRDRYFGRQVKRREAMEGVVGIRRDRSDVEDTDAYLRRLRKGTRLKRIEQ